MTARAAGRTDAGRQSGRPSPGREKPELGLGQADPSRPVISGDPPVAGQCQLEPTAGAGTSKNRHRRHIQRCEFIEDALAMRDESSNLFRIIRLALELAQVGSGDKNFRFGTSHEEAGDL